MVPKTSAATLIFFNRCKGRVLRLCLSGIEVSLPIEKGLIRAESFTERGHPAGHGWVIYREVKGKGDL